MDVVNIELKGPLAAGQDLDEALHLLYANIAKFGCVERTIISTFWHGWGRRAEGSCIPTCASACSMASIIPWRKPSPSWNAVTPTLSIRSWAA